MVAMAVAVAVAVAAAAAAAAAITAISIALFLNPISKRLSGILMCFIHRVKLLTAFEVLLRVD